MQTHKWWRMLSTGMLVLMLLGLLVPSPAATQGTLPPQQAVAAEPGLCQSSAPSGGEVSVLNAVTGVPSYGNWPSRNTLWAVGYASRQTIGAPDIATLTLYFNGREWQVVPSPNLAAENVLTGVAAYAANDVWAVGHSYDGYQRSPLLLHYDELGWKAWPVPLPDFDWIGPMDVRLTGITILSSIGEGVKGPQPDVAAVAVGYMEHLGTSYPIALYYNGEAWKPMTLPTTMLNGRFYSVAGDSLDNLWAVGTLEEEGQQVAHLFHHSAEGNGWMPIAKGLGDLTGLAVSGDSIFTVGHVHTYNGAETLVMAYTHSTGDWSQIQSFNKPDGDDELTAITAEGDKVYAVGYTADPTNDVRHQTLVLAYDGVTFAPVDAPNPDLVSELNGATFYNDMFWAVGTTGHEALRRNLILTDQCPVSTQPCTVSFSDVPATNPFYPYIQCLACRGIVSGYADGTFRWGNEVTRGQLAKIVAGAAGLSATIPATQQMFEDVPSSNMFWLSIERLSGTGAISGYDCGGPGEPCVAPANRPYFRWTADATRGQIAKITALTAGWSGPLPPTQQTFEDVPPTNPFWTWIEKLASNNIVSGYTCGGPGEPCGTPPRPYFRWGNYATRGQTAKIAANMFFPDCQTVR